MPLLVLALLLILTHHQHLVFIEAGVARRGSHVNEQLDTERCIPTADPDATPTSGDSSDSVQLVRQRKAAGVRLELGLSSSTSD